MMPRRADCVAWVEPAAALDEAVAAMRNDEVSARAWVEPWLARIERSEARVHAWVQFDAARVRICAESCDAVQRAGRADGALHGVPVGVKDILATAELPAQMGSPLYAGHHSDRDAAVVARLKAAGAYVMGKTVTTEFAYMQPSVTRNPWNLAHTPGGSSSGSAAAVAAGFVPLAIGTQTHGSVIRPAAYCGVVGFKPTLGSVPSTGCFVFSATLDQIGVFARTVADAARFAAVLGEGEAVGEAELRQAAPPRLGLLARFPWNDVSPAAAPRYEAIAAKLRAAGAQLVPVVLPTVFEAAPRVHRTIMMYEAARAHATFRLHARARLSAVLRDGLDEGASISARDYGAALVARAALMEQAHDLLGDFDALLSPATADGAPEGIETTGDPSFAMLWSLLGAPAISIPAGWSAAAMPLGLQLAAAPGADARLLAAARWCERALAFSAASRSSREVRA